MFLLATTSTTVNAAPVTVSSPVAPPFEGDGTGVCMASAISLDPENELDFELTNYIGGMNQFMDVRKDEWRQYVIRTLLD